MKRVVLIGLAALLSACGNGGGAQPQSKPATAQRASVTVDVVKPTQATWPLTMSANGALAAWQEATISAETGGLRIVALHADVGSRVKRGQLLAELASATVQAEVMKAEASLASARAAQREAHANAARGAAVRDSGALSGQQIEQYEIAEQTAAAAVKQAEADLASARIKLSQTRILAVDDGVISTRTATLGTVVASGGELFRMVRAERVEWRAEVDAGQLAQLKKGMAARVTLPGGATIAGTIRELAPTLDSQSRLAVAYVELPVAPNVRPGMYVPGRIELGQQTALTLPSSAVTMRDGRTYVFEVDTAHKTVIQHEVVTRRTEGDRIEIVKGMEAHTPVVRSGGAFLNDGDAVRISNTREAS